MLRKGEGQGSKGLEKMHHYASVFPGLQEHAIYSHSTHKPSGVALTLLPPNLTRTT
jgi:hypothetical protein